MKVWRLSPSDGNLDYKSEAILVCSYSFSEIFSPSFVQCQGNFPYSLQGWERGRFILSKSIALWGPHLMQGGSLIRPLTFSGPWASTLSLWPHEAIKAVIQIYRGWYLPQVKAGSVLHFLSGFLLILRNYPGIPFLQCQVSYVSDFLKYIFPTFNFLFSGKIVQITFPQYYQRWKTNFFPCRGVFFFLVPFISLQYNKYISVLL